MAKDSLSGISEAIRRAAEAYAEALSSVAKSLNSMAGAAQGPERDRMVESWLRIARMSKDGVITAMEQGFELWEREVRRGVAAVRGSSGDKPPSPFDAWAENWKKATEAFSAGGLSGFGEEARKQADAVQKTLQEGFKAWQRLWDPEKKS